MTTKQPNKFIEALISTAIEENATIAIIGVQTAFECRYIRQWSIHDYRGYSIDEAMDEIGYDIAHDSTATSMFVIDQSIVQQLVDPSTWDCDFLANIGLYTEMYCDHVDLMICDPDFGLRTDLRWSKRPLQIELPNMNADLRQSLRESGLCMCDTHLFLEDFVSIEEDG